ncbi:MAG: hypothetical protein WBQ95_18520 [Terracidiphilus sp.]
MKRRIFLAIGSTLLLIGGAGVVVALAWLTADRLNGSLVDALDGPAAKLVYLLPTLMLVLAIAGAGFLASAITISPSEMPIKRHMHPHLHFHA